LQLKSSTQFSKDIFYRRTWWVVLLAPLSWIFFILVVIRRIFQSQINPSPSLKVPVIVVGNINIGGTGKTPLVIAIARYLKNSGYKPGIVSRGYKGNSSIYPILLNKRSQALDVGDEPLLLADICPVTVDPNRHRAANYLLEKTDCDLILSDDGLQHYKLPRDIEIAVVNGKKKFGNGLLLPAGPLREPVRRLKEVDFIVTNYNSNSPIGKTIKQDEVFLKTESYFTIKPVRLKNLVSGEVCLITSEFSSNCLLAECIKDWKYSEQIHAVAGIGDPQGFADTLISLGFEPILHSLQDHYHFDGDELFFDDDLPVIITAKDAVKCKAINNDKIWVLDIEAIADPIFLRDLLEQVKRVNI
jgi:tetraacyldisaccharide 4'-kinase